MKTVQEIYDHFKLVPSLRMHMLRVTAVGEAICKHRTGPSIDKKTVLTVCLFHDLGNILKFDMTRYPDFFEPEGIEYREGIKEWTKQFGASECDATLEMAKQAGASGEVMHILEELVLNPLSHSVETNDYHVKITDFADMSVTPFEITHWSHRIDDAEERMCAMSNREDSVKHEKMKKRRETMQELNDQILACVDCDLEKLLDDARELFEENEYLTFEDN